MCHRLPAPQLADTKMEDAPEQGDLADAFAAAAAAGSGERQQKPGQPSGAASQLNCWAEVSNATQCLLPTVLLHIHAK